MRLLLIIPLIFILFVSCNDEFDEESFICRNAASEYFPAREAYLEAVQEYESQIESGALQPEMVQGTDVGKIKWIMEDDQERGKKYNDVLSKWKFCPYINHPERMEEFR